MLKLLNYLFHNHRKARVKISWYRLDPDSNILAVYNIREKKIKGFDLIVFNDSNEEYKTNVHSLKAEDEMLLKLQELKDAKGNPFTGNIKTVKAFTGNFPEKYVLKDKGFKRV